MTPLQAAATVDAADCARRLILHNPNLTSVGDEASFVFVHMPMLMAYIPVSYSEFALQGMVHCWLTKLVACLTVHLAPTHRHACPEHVGVRGLHSATLPFSLHHVLLPAI